MMKLKIRGTEEKKGLTALALALFLTACTLLSGCGSAAPSADARETVSFTDSAGRTVEVPADIQAIAPSGAYAQIFLITLCPEKLMGLSTALTRSQKRFLPEYLQELTTFGQFYGGSGDINYEAIMMANPDVIIDIGEKKDTIAEDMDMIQEKTKIPTVFLETSLLDCPDTYTTLGELTGCGERAEELAGYCREVLNTAQANTLALEEEDRVRVYIGDGEYGTSATPSGSIHSEVADLIGAGNVAVLDDYNNSNAQEVSMEQIMLWDPEAVFLTTDANYDEIYEDAGWSTVQAVKDHRVYEIPSSPYNWLDRPPSVQRMLGILWMGNLLYPELYDYDMTEKTQEFYRLFYNYDLKEEEAAELLANSTGSASSPAAE